MYYTSLPPLLVVLLAAVSDVLAEVASLGTCPDVRGGYYCNVVYCLLSFVTWLLAKMSHRMHKFSRKKAFHAILCANNVSVNVDI